MAGVEVPRAVVRLVVGDHEIALRTVDDGTRCDLGLCDDLLRLRLEAQRAGFTVRISEVREELRELFDLMGVTGQLDG